MKKVLSKKLEGFDKPISSKFADVARTTCMLEVKPNGSVVVATRMVALHEEEPECDCGAAEIDEPPCP